jgi:ubiquinone/menaquinone biosynthesis C-methylase UbiE
MSDWLSFWNSPNRIYVNELHRDVHYRDVALQIRSFVPSNTATVIDYGCGESIHADLVAGAAGKLILSDGAAAVRDFLAKRFAAVPTISVLSPAEIAALPPGSIDLIVFNSVSQYLKQPELEALLATFRKLLAPTGTLVVGDVLPPNTNALTEVGALMKLAYANGFVLAAFGGLARTLFSEYRKLRSSLGLTHHTEADMMATLVRAGFSAQRRYPNIEHNQARMTFVARLA